VLKSAPRSPMANAICERVIGTIRRECVDWLIPVSESHLQRTLKSWLAHYNTGRPHMALGPGVPDSPPANIERPHPNSRHRWREPYAVRAIPILGRLHHEYSSGTGRCVIEFLRTTGVSNCSALNLASDESWRSKSRCPLRCAICPVIS
jgi:hypothetical protein